MANRTFADSVRTIQPKIVKLYGHFVANGADNFNWEDDTDQFDAATHLVHQGNQSSENYGIFGCGRMNAAGNHTLVLQDSYKNFKFLSILVGDESTTDDKISSVTILAEDVDGTAAPAITDAGANAGNCTIAGPYIQFQIYDEGGNAQEITDGNHVWFEITLEN